MRILTADLGNSRTKLCAWRADAAPRDAAPLAARALEADAGEDALRAALAGLGPLGSAAISAVGAPERERELCALLRALEVPRVLVAPEPGLLLDVREPARVGRDRLYAARGALEVARGSALVVDAGTALTVDALRAADGAATFLGGAIAPGPALLARALHEHTARLPRVSPAPGARALGRTTEEALLAGVVVGFRGAALELLRRVAAEAGLAGAPVVLTGGAAALLLEPEPFAACIHDPELVHRGLLAAAQAALAP